MCSSHRAGLEELAPRKPWARSFGRLKTGPERHRRGAGRREGRLGRAAFTFSDLSAPLMAPAGLPGFLLSSRSSEVSS